MGSASNSDVLSRRDTLLSRNFRDHVLKMDESETSKDRQESASYQEKPTENEITTSDKVDRTSKSGLHLSGEQEQTLQKESTLMQVLDGFHVYPLKFILQNRAQTELMNMIEAFLESRPTSKEYWSQEGRNILSVVRTIFHDGDQFAIEKGFKHSPQKISRMVTFTSLAIVIAVMVVLFIAGLGDFSMTWYIIIICAFCFLPTFTRRRISDKLTRFQALNLNAFINSHADGLAIVHDMAQYLLSDIREILIDTGNDLIQIKFRLWNSNYSNIKVLDRKFVPGNTKSMNDVRFLKDGEDPNAPDMPSDLNPDVDFDVDSSGKDSSTIDFDDDVGKTEVDQQADS